MRALTGANLPSDPRIDTKIVPEAQDASQSCFNFGEETAAAFEYRRILDFVRVNSQKPAEGMM
jgi:hypothetical protein